MRKYLWLVFRCGFFLLFNYFWIFRYSRNVTKISREKRYNRVRKLLIQLNKRLRGDIIVDGLENVKKGEIKFITPNHLSNFDAISSVILLEEPSAFVAKKEIKKMPFVGRLLKIIQGELLDRDDLKQELRVMRNVKKSLSDNETNWVIFPEGTRNKNYENEATLPFKHGTFKIPLDTQKPILPIASYGSFRVLSTKHHLRKYPVHISILPMIYPQEYAGMNSTELCEMVEKMIQKRVEELRIKDKEYLAKL